VGWVYLGQKGERAPPCMGSRAHSQLQGQSAFPPDCPEAAMTRKLTASHPAQEPRSGSLQCETGNREINCGGKLCSQRLNSLPQR